MARSPNPYQVSSGPYQGIGEGLANLGQLFLGGADPARQAQAEQAAWAARESRENVTDTVDARTGREGLGSLLAEFDPAGDNRQVFARGVGSGAMDVDDLSSLFLAMQANAGGTDEQVGRAYVGTGNTIGTGDGFSLDDREGIAQRDQDNTLQAQAAQDAAAMARTQAQQAGQDRRNRYTVDNDPRRNGSGAGGFFGLDPDQGRYLDAQETMRGELTSMLRDAGVPYSDESESLDTSALPANYFSDVMQQATDAARADRFTRDMSFYLDNAMRNIGAPQEVETVDTKPWWPGGEVDRAVMGEPGQGVDPYFLELFGATPTPAPAQPQQPAPQQPAPQQPAPQQPAPQQPAPQQGSNRPVVRSDADFDALPSGTEFVDEDGNMYRKP